MIHVTVVFGCTGVDIYLYSVLLNSSRKQYQIRIIAMTKDETVGRITIPRRPIQFLQNNSQLSFDWLIDWLIDWLVVLLSDWLIDWLLDCFMFKTVFLDWSTSFFLPPEFWRSWPIYIIWTTTTSWKRNKTSLWRFCGRLRRNSTTAVREPCSGWSRRADSSVPSTKSKHRYPWITLLSFKR